MAAPRLAVALALALAVAAGDALAETGTGSDAAALARFVERTAACTGTDALSLAVVGLPSEQTALSDGEAAGLRLAVEERLLATGRVRLSAARDVESLRWLQEGLRTASPDEIGARLEAAFAGDAAVFLVEPRREGDRVRLRLLAITEDAACKATSAIFEVALGAGPGSADLDRLLARAVAAFAAAAPEAEAVLVCPVETEGGHSACEARVGERLAAALLDEAGSANRTLRARPLAVRQAPPGACGPDTAGPGTPPLVAEARLAHDGQDTWLDLAFRRGAEIVAVEPRTRVSTAALGCDPTARPLIEHVAATGRLDRDRLDVAPAATSFEPGQRLDIAIRLGAAGRLYCWVLADDGTGFVALPTREGAADASAGMRSYPAGFGLDDIVLGGRFEALFHCFAASAALPAALDARWRAAAPSAAEGARLLAPGEVDALLAAMRALPGVVEGAARVVVR
ncbi:MAG: hypothetical protein ACFBWO_17465 [Paracoccaceae bacterium]